jgi:sugar lactone lactonase YvrE
MIVQRMMARSQDLMSRLWWLSPKFIPVVLILLAAAPAWAASFYTVRLNDSKAVYLDAFGARGDGLADDSGAIQQAIDRMQEAANQGIVFVPEGRYRISRTIYIWPAIRLIGYGARRPVFVLAANTPGYQNESEEAYMIFFAGSRPGARRIPEGTPPGAGVARPPDASPGTFYSALSNIDLEIGEGNPGAVGVRGTYAQHCFLAHMDFRLRSGIAAVHNTGNVMEDVRFYGGRYGIWTRKPSPGWQFTAVDAVFEGQREAAIRETEAGLTLIRPQFRDVPTAIAIDDGYPDELWVKDGRMENISGPAVIISLEQNPRTEINMENVACRRVPTFALYRESGKQVTAQGEIYEVRVFSHGLHYADLGAQPELQDIFDAAPLGAMPQTPKSDLMPLPPGETWVNIRTLGAKGDGITDDTSTFRKALAENRAIYLPSGYYVVSDTLTLKPDTVLIGLHPSSTQIILLDRTPAFQGIGNPKPLIETPKGGTNIVIGIGLYTNAINPRAVAVKWMAGKDSLMNDVRFLGGHGTTKPDGTRENPYNNTHTADPDLNRRWDGQYPSLWVTDGGGGTFFDIWTPSTFAQAGMYVSDTSTEGRIYEMSSEHHVRFELQLRNVSNWHIYSLQTEEERGEGGFALPLEIANSSNITIANFHIYRVISMFQPFPWAVKVTNSRDIRFRNFHCYSNSKVSFDAAVFDPTHGLELRQREFAWLTLSGNRPRPAAKPVSTILAKDAKVEKLAGEFDNISGGAVAPNGDFYFVDARWQRIYVWSSATRQLATVRDGPLDPVNLAFDRAGNLMVVSSSGDGTIYSFRPATSGQEITLLKAEPAVPRPGLTVVLPTSDWHLQRDASGTLLGRTYQYLSPDGTTFISATQGFATGARSWGVKSSDLLRSFGLASAAAGQRFYLSSEAEVMTWSVVVGPDGNLSDLKLFAHQGGEGVAADAEGRVYITAGQIYVYSPAGRLIETIETPERPIQVAFGGKDGRTIFIAARTSLYAVRLK